MLNLGIPWRFTLKKLCSLLLLWSCAPPDGGAQTGKKILIYGPALATGAPDNEKTIAEDLGYDVTVAGSNAWLNMTTRSLHPSTRSFFRMTTATPIFRSLVRPIQTRTCGRRPLQADGPLLNRRRPSCARWYARAEDPCHPECAEFCCKRSNNRYVCLSQLLHQWGR